MIDSNSTELGHNLIERAKEDAKSGIPFSTPDEGTDYPKIAKELIVIDRKQAGDPEITLDDVYVITFSYILGNWKALVSTNRPNGIIYEVTYNALKDEYYVDFYVKKENTVYDSNFNSAVTTFPSYDR